MIEPVTLAEAKTHLRVAIDDDDDYISTLITAARQHVEDYQNRVYASYTIGEGDKAVTVEAEIMPATVKVACLLLIGHFYDNRSAVSEKQMYEVPLTVKRLLDPHRIHSI